jgi:hypothetical protein
MRLRLHATRAFLATLAVLLTAALGSDSSTCTDSDFCRTEGSEDGWTSDFSEDDLATLYTYEHDAKTMATDMTARQGSSISQLYRAAVGLANSGDFQRAVLYMKACTLRAPDNVNYEINLGERAMVFLLVALTLSIAPRKKRNLTLSPCRLSAL